ncbi:MAG: YndJ family transporter [Saprospiraceae bacterium]|nr:YndJ family transporter [Saprospiraceae bacterium]
MKSALSLIAWFIWVLLAGSDYCQIHWETALILFAAWVLVPEGLALLKIEPSLSYFATVLFLSVSYRLEQPYGAWMAAPYVLFALWLTIREAARLLEIAVIRLTDVVRVAALAYWATGALFALFSLAGWQTLGFDPAIVALTAAHFHVAGFVLTSVVYCMSVAVPGTYTGILGWTSIAGMPAVATGIVLTHFGYPSVFEEVSALFFVVFAVSIVVWHVVRARDRRFPRASRRLWLAGAVCLLAGITLACLYALRFQVLIEWINISNMKIWHGTLNTLGFAWLTLLGWRLNTH